MVFSFTHFISPSHPGHLPDQPSPHPPPGKIPPQIQQHPNPPNPPHPPIIPPPIPLLHPLPPSQHHPSNPFFHNNSRSATQKKPPLPPPPASNNPPRHPMHNGTRSKTPHHFPYIRPLPPLFPQQDSLKPFTRPHAKHEEQSREQAMPAVTPKFAHGGNIPHASRIERRKERERVRRQRGQQNRKQRVPERKRRHQERPQRRRQHQLQPRGQVVEPAFLHLAGSGPRDGAAGPAAVVR